MPMIYAIDRTKHIVRITGSGALTDRDMTACVSALRADPELKPDMPTLSDMRNIEIAFTPKGIRQMIEVMRNSPSERAQVKAAIVVSSNIAFGMGRMFQLYSNTETEPTFRIFRDMTEAELWLGLDPST